MVRILVLCLVAAAATGCASSGAVPTPRPFPGAPLPPRTAEPVTAHPPDADGIGVADAPAAPGRPADADEAALVVSHPLLVTTALAFRGTPYRNGGSDPSGFDCSGFVQWVFAHHGTKLPREVRDQYQVGAGVDRDDVQPGDLVFFETVSRGASHVGIAIGGGEFVHAPSSRGVVRVEKYTTGYWAQRWVGARRIS